MISLLSLNAPNSQPADLLFSQIEPEAQSQSEEAESLVEVLEYIHGGIDELVGRSSEQLLPRRIG